MHLVIIGNGAAGITAARTARELLPSARVTVISDEPGPAYARCLIPEVLAGDRDPRSISFVPPGFYREHRISLLSGRLVVSLDAVGRRLTLEDGETISYDRLLVATGASPVLPDWPGADLPGVFTLRTVAQAATAGEAARRCASAVVAGGGLVSLKAAWALKRCGVAEVTVVVKSPHLLVRQLDEQGAALVQRELSRAGIKFLFGLDLAAITGGAGGRRQVELEDGRTLPAGLVLVGKGVRPNVQLVRRAGGRVGQGITVNERLETTLPGVYAAGDCVEVQDLLTGAKTNSALWTLAVEQGRIAGCNMAGRPRRYSPPLTRLYAAQFGSVPFVSVGDVRGDGETAAFQKDRVYRKLCFREDRLVGFIMVGWVERAGIYTALVRRGRPLGRLKQKLLDGTVSAADLMVMK